VCSAETELRLHLFLGVTVLIIPLKNEFDLKILMNNSEQINDNRGGKYSPCKKLE